MTWISWSRIWATRTTTTSRKPLRWRLKNLGWKRMYLLLRADQRLKQNHENALLVAHLQKTDISLENVDKVENSESNIFLARECWGFLKIWESWRWPRQCELSPRVIGKAMVWTAASYMKEGRVGDWINTWWWVCNDSQQKNSLSVVRFFCCQRDEHMREREREKKDDDIVLWQIWAGKDDACKTCEV